MSRQNPPSKKTRSTLRRMRFRKKKRARPLGSKRANKAAQLIHYTGRSTAPISTRVAAPRKRVSVGVTCRLSMSRKNGGECRTAAGGAMALGPDSLDRTRKFRRPNLTDWKTTISKVTTGVVPSASYTQRNPSVRVIKQGINELNTQRKQPHDRQRLKSFPNFSLPDWGGLLGQLFVSRSATVSRRPTQKFQSEKLHLTQPAEMNIANANHHAWGSKQ